MVSSTFVGSCDPKLPWHNCAHALRGLHWTYWIIQKMNPGDGWILSFDHDDMENVAMSRRHHCPCRCSTISFVVWCLSFFSRHSFYPLAKCSSGMWCGNRDYRSTVWISWWRHQMEPFSMLLALCVGNSPVTGEFPSQRPVTRRFDVFFDLRQNKRLSKQRRRFHMPFRSLWRHCNVGYLVRVSLVSSECFVVVVIALHALSW